MDAIIRWVNREDPEYIADLKRYGVDQPQSDSSVEDSESPVPSGIRIQNCVRSILRYAPFIRRIFIISPGHDPQLTTVLADYPERDVFIELIDHSSLFKGFESVLPCFNPLAIETMLWAIPGLSEQFIYFREEYILTKPTIPRNWFDDKGNIICNTTGKNILVRGLLKLLKNEKESINEQPLLNSAALLGKKYILLTETGPQPMLRSILKDYFEINRDLMEENISYRFPSPSQFSVPQLFLLLAEDL